MHDHDRMTVTTDPTISAAITPRKHWKWARRIRDVHVVIGDQH
jgi:hypothetical protein